MMNKYKLVITIAIFFLPFTQAPTLKFFMRWRISELITWFLLPFHLKVLQHCIRKMPSPARWVLGAIGGYFIYTGLIGIVHAPFIEVRVEKTLEYFLSPILRTFLETARGFASFSLLIGVLTTVTTWDEFQRLLKVFVWSGAISGGYSLYQATVLSFGLSLPLLPGTLYHEGYARPFGTFYEPTGTGSFTATTILLTLYFLLTECKPKWLFCLALNGLGFFVSLSRAGWIGLIIGFSVLFLILNWLGHKFLWSIVSAIIVSVVLWLGYLISVELLGEWIVRWSFSPSWLEYTGQERIMAYTELPFLLQEFPFGYGQGLFIFHSGGAPGFMRLIIEGGFIGTIFLIILHVNIIRCLLHILNKYSSKLWNISPFLAASYVSCFIITLNYINITDMWIWFIWELPAIALLVDQKIQVKEYMIRKK